MGTLKFKARSRRQRAPARPRRHATHRRPGTPPPAGWPRARGRQHHHSRAPPKQNPPWGAFSLCVAVCRRPGQTPRRASRRRSAVHLGRRAPRLNSPVLAPRHHAHTSRMRRPPIKGIPSLPACATRPVGPPLTPSRWTCSPASSRRRPRLPSSSLDTTQARTPAYSHALHRCSPDFEPRRPHRRSHAATAHRSPLKLSYRRQSLPSESNCTPRATCWPPLAVDHRRRARPHRKGHGCESQGHSCEPRDLVVRICNLVS
jgi:hypothetical protein